MKHYFETADCANYELLKENARHNRNNPTEAEDYLWHFLSGGINGCKFRRQHIISNYIADFVCLSQKLIIEIDGEYHNTPNQMASDQERTSYLQQYGFRVIRFSNDQVLMHTDDVIRHIKSELF